MKRYCLAAVLAVATAAPAFAMNYGGYQIHISCYRGPWKEVIWDRPNPVFVDSLVNAGYGYATATAIAERICRDPALVGRPGSMSRALRAILSGTARY